MEESVAPAPLHLRSRFEAPGSGEAVAAVLLDLGHALRALRGTPVVTAVVVLTLAVGVGLNTAIFSVVDAVLLRGMEYRGAERLVQVSAEITASGERTRTRMTGGESARVAGGVSAFEETAAVTFIRQNLGGAGLPRQVAVGWVSGNFFLFLGVEPVLGRTFTPEDAPGAVLLSHALWQEVLGADSAVVGRTVTLDGAPHEIVGVLPPRFRFHMARFASGEVELWKNPDRFWQNGDVWGPDDFQGSGMLQVVGRLAPTATLEQARAELAVVAADVRRLEPARARADLAYSADYLHAEAVAGVRPVLIVLFGAVAGVLLIACANVMGLLLVRSRQRVRELALRRALGAPRTRLVRLLLMEGAVLALVGGVGGLLLAWGGTEVLAAAAPPFPRAETVSVDGRVFLFALVVSLGCTMVVGLVPAIGASRAEPVVEAHGQRTLTGGGNAVRQGLVVAQIAVSVVLLVGTGLLSSTLIRLRSVDPGFDPRGVLTFAVSLPGTRYEWPAASGRFLVELEERIRGLAGVEEAGIMWPVPMSGSRWAGLYEGGEVRGEEGAYADYRVGTAGYFATLGIGVREGRLHRPDDAREAVVVSARVAERLWPDQPAVGRALRADPWGGGMRDFEVIGVVEDVRYTALREEPAGAVYFDVRGWSWTDWEFDVVVRAGQDPLSLVPEIREVLARMDPEIPLADPTLMITLMERQTRDTRFALSLVGLFSAVAGLLALLGLYGVLSYVVGLRTREIGLRMALGSATRSVYRLVLGQALRITVAGLALGLLSTLWLTRFLAALLFDVQPTDPTIYAVVVSTLLGLALLAGCVPARRAVRIDPASVLRSE
jgi:predicted permease